jgi:hypothetical protein
MGQAGGVGPAVRDHELEGVTASPGQGQMIGDDGPLQAVDLNVAAKLLVSGRGGLEAMYLAFRLDTLGANQGDVADVGSAAITTMPGRTKLRMKNSSSYST